MDKRLPSYVTIVTAAVLLWFGTLYSAFWFLALIGFSFFLYSILFQTSTSVGALVRGFLIGLASGGAGVLWLLDMFPIDFLPGMSTLGQLLLIDLVWSITALLAGVTSGLAALLLYLFKTNKLFPLIAGFVWIVQEEARMWLYALYSYSSESLLGAHFSQTASGYTLASQPYLLQLAYPFGLTALTFSFVVFSCFLAYLLRSYVNKSLPLTTYVAGGITLLLLLAPLFIHPPVSDTIPLRALVFSTTETLSQEDLQVLFEDAISKHPEVDMIVFPEGIHPTFLTDDNASRFFPDKDVLVISSDQEQTITSYTNSISYQSTKTGVIAAYHKLFLMPQGEYFPAIATYMYPLSGDSEALAQAETLGKRLTRGEELVVAKQNTFVIGGLICSDILSPRLYASLVRDYGATVLVNISNPSWFRDSKTYHQKIEQIAKVHAVQNNRSLILASHRSPSFVINPSGVVIYKSMWDTPEVVFVELAVPVR
jgi:apolipoprotein N-acyltransferase